MKLIEKIKIDQLTARKRKVALEAKLLTTLIGEAETMAKNNGEPELNDQATVALIKKFMKNINETIPHVQAGQTLDDLNSEITILQQYLPRQLSESELRTIIAEIAECDSDPKSVMGYIQKSLKARFNGQYDGAVATKLIKEYLK